MKIAILGNGKMGKKISELATKKGYEIVCVTSSKRPATSVDLKLADVAIDFSIPDTAFENIKHAINSGIPVISGTTGWLERKNEIEELCIKKGGAFLYSSNFSLGVNLFFKLNRTLAKLMKKHNYKSKIHEIHHTQKIDSPSGTAKTLAEHMDVILRNTPPIHSERKPNVIGTHIINYYSEIDEIEIKHFAKNRDGFATGAIVAAEWIIEKKGIFNMSDVLSQ